MRILVALIPPLVVAGLLIALVITAARATDWADTTASARDDRPRAPRSGDNPAASSTGTGGTEAGSTEAGGPDVGAARAPSPPGFEAGHVERH